MGHGHAFWSLLIPQKIRCYEIELQLAAGMRYRLEEDPDSKEAWVLRDDTGECVARGRLADEHRVFSAVLAGSRLG
jgi:hypothetical protein